MDFCDNARMASRQRHGATARASLLALLLLASAAARADDAPSPWALPPEDACSPQGGLRGWPVGEDAPVLPFAPGDALDLEATQALRNYLPAELWTYRERFFFEGMRLVIGPCFRDYAPPGFFGDATRRFAGRARLTADSGLEDYVAGLPFPPTSIRPDDPRVGLRWAWNVAHRYQGAGFRGHFRVSDIVGPGRTERFEGEIFKILLSHRADRNRPVAGTGSDHWVAGGVFSEPTNAREFAWRQFRDVSHQREPERSDDLHAYIPGMRRVMRLNASHLEGIYMPSFAVGVQDVTVASFGGNATGPSMGGAASLAAGSSISSKRSGFEGLELRPLLYRHEVLGVRDVLAPINVANPLYPASRERAFGPWGLSFADDRWELRRALVLSASRLERRSEDDPQRILRYVDLQTLHPLYYISYGADGDVIDVGVYAGRWSEDRPDYPPWPDDEERPVRVIDSVAAAFANIRLGGGWRRESGDMVATPLSAGTQRKLISVNQLTKRH